MSHCCDEMTSQVELICEQHKEDMSECPDKMIHYEKIFDEYGLVYKDGGNSTLLISFCPFCGKKLPKSKRDLWFEELHKLGIEDMFDPNIKEKYLSDEWRKDIVD